MLEVTKRFFSFPFRGDQKPYLRQWRGCMNFWSLNYIVNVTSAHQGQLEYVHTAYFLIPRKSSTLTPHGAESSVWLQYPQNTWGLLLESLLTMCSSSIDFFLSVFKEDTRKYLDFNVRLLWHSPNKAIFSEDKSYLNWNDHNCGFSCSAL